MDYHALLERLYGLSPKGIELGLTRLRHAAQQLGDPQTQLLAIQVAGTNGKGTVCALLEQAFRSAGATTGLYTSPHLHRFTERFRVNGEEVAQEVLSDALARVFPITEGAMGIPLTFFEVATLAAVLVFADADVDVAIMEVGLGGRLDATSLVHPSVTVITSIGMDHTDYLGDTLGEIAAEKAGIVRTGVPLYCGPLGNEAMAGVEQVANARLVEPRVLGRDFEGAPLPPLPVPGEHMRQNARLARQVFEETAPALALDVDVPSGHFEQTLPTMPHPARFERVGEHWLLDGAHNLEAAVALASSLEETGASIGTLVFGALDGKPSGEMAKVLFPLARRVIVVSPPVPRGFDAKAFAAEHDVEVASDTSVALGMVSTDGEGLHLVTGSFFLAAEARRLLLGEAADPPLAL